MAQPLSDFQDIIKYKFKNEELLRVALTHSSTGGHSNYERLEFLGDRVLGLVISSMLFVRFPDEKEGDLAKRLASLVQGQTLAKLSSEISLGEYIYFSDAEAAAGGAQNEHILADVLEAVLGAIYLDAGLEPCQKLIQDIWQDIIHTMTKPPQHPKTEIQEWAQGQGLPLPTYEVISQTGPDHAPKFVVQLNIQGHDPIQASGRSRAEAEKAVAKEFLKGIA